MFACLLFALRYFYFSDMLIERFKSARSLSQEFSLGALSDSHKESTPVRQTKEGHVWGCCTASCCSPWPASLFFFLLDTLTQQSCSGPKGNLKAATAATQSVATFVPVLALSQDLNLRLAWYVGPPAF